jgi:hypothetical protein
MISNRPIPLRTAKELCRIAKEQFARLTCASGKNQEQMSMTAYQSLADVQGWSASAILSRQSA